MEEGSDPREGPGRVNLDAFSEQYPTQSSMAGLPGRLPRGRGAHPPGRSLRSPAPAASAGSLRRRPVCPTRWRRAAGSTGSPSGLSGTARTSGRLSAAAVAQHPCPPGRSHLVPLVGPERETWVAASAPRGSPAGAAGYFQSKWWRERSSASWWVQFPLTINTTFFKGFIPLKNWQQYQLVVNILLKQSNFKSFLSFNFCSSYREPKIFQSLHFEDHHYLKKKMGRNVHWWFSHKVHNTFQNWTVILKIFHLERLGKNTSPLRNDKNT